MVTKFYRVEIYHCYDAGFSYKEELSETMVFSSISPAFRYISVYSSSMFSFLNIKFDYLERLIRVYFVP